MFIGRGKGESQSSLQNLDIFCLEKYIYNFVVLFGCFDINSVSVNPCHITDDKNLTSGPSILHMRKFKEETVSLDSLNSSYDNYQEDENQC